MNLINRRTFIAATGGLLVGACSMQTRQTATAPIVQPLMLVPDTPEPFPVAAVDLSKIDPKYHRQMVPNPTGESAGTLVVDTDNRFLYLAMEGGQALRYGVGIGREGFGWSGRATVKRKAEWPTWTPTPYMMGQDPELLQFAGGMPGGPDNPLGARALYLFEGDRDTLYRIHGTSEPQSIGRAVSSGCVRLLNADVINLYNRVPIGSRVVVLPSKDGVIAHDHPVA